jgi:hypothetical protein
MVVGVKPHCFGMSQKVFGPDILQEAEKQVCMVRENMRIAQSR